MVELNDRELKEIHVRKSDQKFVVADARSCSHNVCFPNPGFVAENTLSGGRS
jgi:hypothetical protein